MSYPANREPPANSHASGARPILPAPVSPGQEGVQKLPDGGSLSSQRLRPMPKRSQITPVACQPCQQRKSKCNGTRPVCSSCSAKRRNDCVYDAAGDQRRTSALKKKIQELEKQTCDLKDIIALICSAADRDAAISMVQQLQVDGYRSLDSFAMLLRSRGIVPVVPLPVGDESSQGSPLTPLMPEIGDPSYINDYSFSYPGSLPYMSPITPTNTDNGWQPTGPHGTAD